MSADLNIRGDLCSMYSISVLFLEYRKQLKSAKKAAVDKSIEPKLFTAVGWKR